MAATALKGSMKRIEGTVIGCEAAVLSIGVAAETLATAGATIPAKTTRILFIPTHAVHKMVNGTPTASVGDAVAAGEPVVIEHSKIGRTKFIRDAGGDTTAVVVYLR